MSDKIKTYEEPDQVLMLFAGLEDAFIGQAEMCGKPPVACYSKAITVEVLQKKYDISKKEAQKKLEYEYLQTSFGDATPVFLDDELAKPIH